VLSIRDLSAGSVSGHAVVMGFPVLDEDLGDVWFRLVAIRLEACPHEAPAKAGPAYYDVHDSDGETAVEKGDEELIGYIHSAQLGRRPRLTIRRIPDRLPPALPVLSQSRHVAQAKWQGF